MIIAPSSIIPIKHWRSFPGLGHDLIEQFHPPPRFITLRTPSTTPALMDTDDYFAYPVLFPHHTPHWLQSFSFNYPGTSYAMIFKQNNLSSTRSSSFLLSSPCALPSHPPANTRFESATKSHAISSTTKPLLPKTNKKPQSI